MPAGQTWAGTSPSVLALGALISPSVGCCLAAPIDMQLARLVARESRSARLPGSQPSPHAIPPIANIPSGQANIQISDDIVAVASFGRVLRPSCSTNYRTV